MIKDLIVNGIQTQIDRANEAEKGKSGSLRGGNTGMMNEKGQIIGSCAATTYLRMLGVNGLQKVDVDKELMFAGGRLNEDHWLSALKESYESKESGEDAITNDRPYKFILCETEIPTKWQTKQGIDVTGRPDIVLCESQEGISELPKSVCGIELKQCMSINSAYGILVNREPQLKHLMQTAHYMWQLDCPFELWYTNRNNLDMPSWMEFRKFPGPGEKGSRSLNYRYYRSGNINPKTGKPIKHQLDETEFLSGKFERTYAQACKITPFVQGFKLKMDENGQVSYQDAIEIDAPWIETIVNVKDIERFYNYIGDMKANNKVPKPAMNLKISGDKMNWKFSAYSDLQHLDPEYCHGQPLDEWVEKVKKFVLDKKNS